ncbi:putative transcriptional regulatory protein [Candidatus Xiphinematobacter sp. Idaho Grape]|uniref:YebC/PmpR family DNA-binding transcriptional regulator n=1 Tax=Candidatus Xiphinematobacter sp. Idaho Grape TaxID=1704307 RepID=UPI0007059637|nr:YebC/PmpR family DNA-binding transcriptional regulator [Candidatus Xiphinematobacter sp. Idaho Grape]ALJ56860.1 putative transcriptional regulatory protein [Candidatus Xiphinematobacter sp. Idaho Grape]
MAGHSKWSKVKRLKGTLDAKRGKLFSKLSKEIMIAARLGGGNFLLNPRLRAAVQSARSKSMPNENIVRAIKRGERAASATVSSVEQVLYEGYGAGGVALIVEAATDNRNRTAAVLRSLFSKKQGVLGGPGSVSHLFLRKGQIFVSKSALQEERLLEAALQAGAEDLVYYDESFAVLTSPNQFHLVAESLRNFQVPIESQQLTFLPQRIVHISDLQTASYILQLCDVLENHDDVLHVHSNFDISEELLAKIHPN